MQIEQFADMIKECSDIVFFGGAGVSTESGVKDFSWPGKSHGRRSLVGCSPWDLEESDMTEAT